MPGSSSVDRSNIDFYNRHTAKISVLAALNDPDYSPEEDARATRELRSIDPTDLHDCLLLAPAIVSLTPHAMTGSGSMAPSERIGLAKSTSDLAEFFHAERLKKNFSTMADEVRRNAYKPRWDSPVFKAALVDTNNWARTRCSADKK